jgi:uncharacterized protein with HEPN domain
MRPEERDAGYLWDMLSAGREAYALVEGMEIERLLEDRLRLLALERLIEIVGESAGRVSDGFRQRCPGIDWQGLKGQRNVLAHEYGRINHRLLCEAARTRLPALIATLENTLGGEAR